MRELNTLVDLSTLMFVAIGFGAQLCDGALGMGFGAISSTVLTLIGLPREIVSATVNGAKILTGTASTVSHLAYKNVQWRALAYLSIGGVLGGLIGAWLLTQASLKFFGSLISGYLILTGFYIIWKASHVEQLWLTATRISGVGVAAGFLEAVAGVWGPLATSNLVASGLPARMAIGVGNVAETLVAVVVFTVLVNCRLGISLQDSIEPSARARPVHLAPAIQSRYRYAGAARSSAHKFVQEGEYVGLPDA
ncbi:MAG: sulfite exporter TauE/SafE family protein, partial [Steroidobacteraceae bacterium]